jgi:XTP/dITP diphosphohydrolase
MKIAFITTNKYKFQEVSDILKGYRIDLEHVDMEYEENHDASMDAIATSAAKKLAEQLHRPVVLEDTGLFFEAYKGFPGALPKFVFNTLGYKGIFKLLAGESRAAFFRTVVGYCEPGLDPVKFEGKMSGVITDSVHDELVDVMPYDRIFIPDSKTITISKMTLKEKNLFSQRGQAFRKFAEYITKNTDNGHV